MPAAALDEGLRHTPIPLVEVERLAVDLIVLLVVDQSVADRKGHVVLAAVQLLADGEEEFAAHADVMELHKVTFPEGRELRRYRHGVGFPAPDARQHTAFSRQVVVPRRHLALN